MTFWDILLLVLTLALVVEGLWKGAVRLGFGLAGLVAGYLYAGHMAGRVAGYLTFVVEHLRGPVALALGFFLVFTVFVLVGAIVHSVVKKSGLGCVNRVLGAVLGLVASIYVAGGFVHIAGRLSPDLAAKVTAGPVVRLMADWALGMGTLIPPLPPLRPASPPPEKPMTPESPASKPPPPKGDAT
jgi:hypothetical protein